MKLCKHPRMEMKSRSVTYPPYLVRSLRNALDDSVCDYFLNIVASQISWIDKCIHSLLQRLFHWLHTQREAFHFILAGLAPPTVWNNALIGSIQWARVIFLGVWLVKS